MASHSSPHLLLVLLIGVLGLWEGCADLSPDGLALLAFKSAVSGDPSTALAEWDESDADPCRWPGVSCSNVSTGGAAATPRVVGLAVSGKNLSGYIPSELGSLLFLRRLNLHGNRLHGSIPAQLFNASSLHSIFLYDNNLSGPIPPPLCDLPRLQNLDLSRNSISGPIPLDLRNCRQLQRLLVSENKLSGKIPDGIWREMGNLIQLDLSSNELNGSIPADLGDLDSLGGTLNISHNRFSGDIPASLGRLPAAVSLDLRFNNLSGEIPQTGSLANQGPTAFLNNPLLCGFPLQTPCPGGGGGVATSPAPPGQGFPVSGSGQAPPRRGLRPALIILISVADAAGVALIGLVLVYVYWKLKDSDKGCSCTGRSKLGGRGIGGGGGGSGCMDCCKAASGYEEEDGEGESEAEKGEGVLVAIDKGFSFELDELLRASAYVLGKSGMGIVYKVVLGNGVPVAVRRLGEGGGQRYKEFAAEAQAIGRARHPNVVRLRAYYWAPDEKLLITDFVSNGSLAAALKGRSSEASISWAIRLRIARGAARGLAYLHECSPRKFVHGNVKPSNILLDADFNPQISDFGLIRLLSIAGSTTSANADVSASTRTTPPSSGALIGGVFPSVKAAPHVDRPNPYRAPEARSAGTRPTQKWDVYSFGVVMLELLTGKPLDFTSPAAAAAATSSFSSSPSEGVVELVRWVRKGFDDANPLSEMVDPVLLSEVHAKKEVLSMFHVALACTDVDPDARPRMKAVSENLDRIG